MSDEAAPPSVEGVAHVEELRGRGSLSEHLREKFTLPAFILSVILTSALLWRAHSLLRREWAETLNGRLTIPSPVRITWLFLKHIVMLALGLGIFTLVLATVAGWLASLTV